MSPTFSPSPSSSPSFPHFHSLFHFHLPSAPPVPGIYHHSPTSLAREMDNLIDAIGYTLSQPARTFESEIPPTQRNDAYSSANAAAPHTRPLSSSPRTHPQTQYKAPYRCQLCNRTYERADHLNRHLKSHENARPHKCSRCTKSFNRADLLNRHEASHDRHANNARPQIERGERVAAACQACVQSKSKCQDRKPCLRCVKKGIACEGGNGSRDATANMQESTISNSNGHGLETRNDLDGQMGFETSISRLSQTIGSNITGDQIEPAHQLSNNTQGHKSGPEYYNDTSAPNATTAFFENSYNDFTYLPDDSFGQGLGFTPQDSYFNQDLDFNMWDIDLDSVELAYQSNGTQLEDSNHPLAGTPRNSQKDVSKRYAAFERSPWLWTPTQKDQALNDQENLNLDEENIPSVITPDSPAAKMDDFISCSIDSRARDKMIGMLFTVRKTATQIPHFPSLDLLNSIIQVYFVQESFRVDHTIHSATFDSKKVLPQLLIAIVSAGSTWISTPAIWKLGLALQEVVRHGVADFFEQDNSHTRNLQALQAFMIVLDVGLWSGFKRKMEIAESFAQPIIVMLRRAGAFAALRNPSAYLPQQSDSDAVLEAKWRKWAEKESWKRLVLHLFMHDIHASIGLQKPPLISFTELKFSLPASRELWLAKSATAWRDRYLPNQSSPTIIATLTDAMHTPDLSTHFSTLMDTHLSAITILHGFWGQIWTLLESKKFYPPSKATHRLCLLTSYSELYRDLVAFSSQLPSMTRFSVEATLIAEMFMMILHASPEDVQRFAGKFGEDEARKASVEFTEWSKSIESRTAIWHAGQVFRAAKRLGQAQCRGFNAIAVYYASLTLWIYGLMISAPQTSSNSNLENSSRLTKERIVLNEAVGPSSRIWRSNNDGNPGLTVMSLDGSEQFVSVEATDRILQLGRQIYKDNFPGGILGSEASVPPLVENLGNLLRDLGSLPGSRTSRAPSEGAG